LSRPNGDLLTGESSSLISIILNTGVKIGVSEIHSPYLYIIWDLNLVLIESFGCFAGLVSFSILTLSLKDSGFLKI
jgi:hypothetical protein